MNNVTETEREIMLKDVENEVNNQEIKEVKKLGREEISKKKKSMIIVQY